MKKDIEWLKEEMDSMHRMRDLDRNPDEWFISKTALLKAIDQLDESEVLSEYWIEQKSIDTHVDTLSGEIQVTFRLDDLQNLVVPKQRLPVIPKFVAEYIKWYENSFIYTFDTDTEYIIYLLEVPLDFTESERVKEWRDKSGNAQKLIDAYRWGYEFNTEKEIPGETGQEENNAKD